MASPVTPPEPIQNTELAGMPTFQVPSPGPTLGMLIFRVGSADEQLSHAGITHLVEHLALYRMASQPTAFSYNAAVEQLSTAFWARGTPDEVGDYLSRVCTALQDLPLERLPDEVRVLQAERADSAPLVDRMLAVRFGAITYGLRAYPELGLGAVDGNAVREWSRRWFVRRNCALAFVGEMPGELSLELPEGDSPASVPSSGRKLRLPGWKAIGEGAIAVTAIGPRSTEAFVALACAQRSLSDRLRRDQGMAYAVKAVIEPLYGSLAHVALWTSTATEDSEEGLTSFTDTLLRLLAEGPDAALLDAVKEARRRSIADADQAPARLAQRALDHLTEVPAVSDQTQMQEIDAITVERIAAVSSEWSRTAILFTPDATKPACDTMTLRALPIWSERRLHGRRFVRATSQRLGAQQVYASAEGVMAVTDAERVLTIPFDECVAMVVPSPKDRVLYGADSTFLFLHAEDWRDWTGLARMIDQGVPSSRQIVTPDWDHPEPAQRRWYQARWSLTPTWRGLVVFFQFSAALVMIYFLFFGLTASLPHARAQWLPVVVFTALLVVIPALLFRR